jgi:YgiT-type zinc finger domain-containing protein
MAAKNICDFCGKKGTRERRITRIYGRGSNLLVIEQVPLSPARIVAKVI